MRLTQRSIRIWNESYLAYHGMWRNIDIAAHEIFHELDPSVATVLDIGCGHKPYADLFKGCHHIGLNSTFEDANPDVLGDAMSLPFAPNTVDLVFCTQVLEHVSRPQKLIDECARVLRPGGWMILSAPFYWPLHEEPFDYFRFTKHGLQHLLQSSGFRVHRISADGGDGSRLMISILQALPRWAGLAARLPCNMAGIALDRLQNTAVLPLNYTTVSQLPGTPST